MIVLLKLQVQNHSKHYLLGKLARYFVSKLDAQAAVVVTS